MFILIESGLRKSPSKFLPDQDQTNKQDKNILFLSSDFSVLRCALFHLVKKKIFIFVPLSNYLRITKYLSTDVSLY